MYEITLGKLWNPKSNLKENEHHSMALNEKSKLKKKQIYEENKVYPKLLQKYIKCHNIH